MQLRPLSWVFACLAICCTAFAQDSQKKSARFPDAVVYQSFLTRALMLREYDRTLPPDPTRSHVLQRRFPQLNLTLKDCKKIDDAVDKAQDRMKANAADANAFFQAVKQQYGDMAPAEIPQSHKDKLKQLNSDREAGALRLKQDLQATFDTILFERFDSRLHDEASSRIQTIVKGDKAQ